MVASILTVVALVALPAREPVESFPLDGTRHEIAEAIRFARSEALRTGSAFGVEFETSRLRVFRADASTAPATLVYDVVHPLSRRAYVVDLTHQPSRPAIELVANTIFTSSCDFPSHVVFDGTAEPRCLTPVGTLLSSASLTLTLGGIQRMLAVDGTTGRVTQP